MEKNVFLIGFMGTGKSTVSRELVKLLDFQEMDMDQEIEARENKKINEIFQSHGEEYFRVLETRLIAEFENTAGYVISCGGGAVLRQENVDSMKKSGIVVLLTGTPQTIYRRVRQSNHRPLLQENMNVAYIAELMKKREKCYQAAADLAVETDERRPQEIAEIIIKEMEAKKMQKNAKK